MAKDARIPIRVPQALKDEFEWAAAADGVKGVSAWLRQLGEERADDLRSAAAGKGKTIEDATAAQAARNAIMRTIVEHRGDEPAAVFVPGFGLDEED